MRSIVRKLKPSRGFSHVIYVLLNLSLPLIIFALVKWELVLVAFVIILLSKWRMFAVRFRFWWANVVTNAVDIIVGLSVLVFMVEAPNDWVRLAYAAIWALWLIVAKPKVSVLWVSIQALAGQVAGLMALYVLFPKASLLILVATTGLVCFFAAHHFFYSFDETYTNMLSYLWGYFGAATAWVLSHWLIYYWVVAQPALLLISLSTVLGSLYYLDHFDKLSKGVRRQLVFVGCAVVCILWIAMTYFYWLHGSRTIV